jgi:hypothetical protein
MHIRAIDLSPLTPAPFLGRRFEPHKTPAAAFFRVKRSGRCARNIKYRKKVCLKNF